MLEELKSKVIIDIQCGEEFSLCLSDVGDIFSFGRGKEGQLGHGNRESLNVPTKIASLAHERVVQVAAGWQHSLALTDTGRVFQWGSLHHLVDHKRFQVRS